MMESIRPAFLLLLLLALPAYAQDGPIVFSRPLTPIYETESYQVFKDNTDPKRHLRVVHVVLLYRYSEDMTQQFAEEIMAQGDSSVAWTNVLFYYPIFGPTDTYYATARSDDQLPIRFNGPDQVEVDSLKSDRFLPSGAVSSWISDLSARRYDLVQQDGEWSIHLQYTSGKYQVWPLTPDDHNTYIWTDQNGVSSIPFIVSEDGQSLEIKGYWDGFAWDIAESFR